MRVVVSPSPHLEGMGCGISSVALSRSSLQSSGIICCELLLLLLLLVA